MDRTPGRNKPLIASLLEANQNQAKPSLSIQMEEPKTQHQAEGGGRNKEMIADTELHQATRIGGRAEDSANDTQLIAQATEFQAKSIHQTQPLATSMLFIHSGLNSIRALAETAIAKLQGNISSADMAHLLEIFEKSSNLTTYAKHILDSGAVGEFINFPRLPIELRLKIWEETLPGPRIVEIFWSNRYNHCTGLLVNNPPPVSMHVCREARIETMKRFSLLLDDGHNSIPNNQPTIRKSPFCHGRIDPNFDIVYIPWSNPKDDIFARSDPLDGDNWSKEAQAKLQHLAIDSRMWDRFDHISGQHNYVESICVTKFKNLKNLTIILHTDEETGPWICADAWRMANQHIEFQDLERPFWLQGEEWPLVDEWKRRVANFITQEIRDAIIEEALQKIEQTGKIVEKEGSVETEEVGEEKEIVKAFMQRTGYVMPMIHVKLMERGGNSCCEPCFVTA